MVPARGRCVLPELEADQLAFFMEYFLLERMTNRQTVYSDHIYGKYFLEA